MSELDKLHAAVVQAPEADEPRIVYANAVQSSDPDRAELIRAQVKLTDMRRNVRPLSELADLDSKAQLLLERHEGRWAKPVTELPGIKFFQFYRGFVEQVRMSARDFLDHGQRVFARAPILHLDLVDLKRFARDVFKSPLLAQIHSMRLWRNQLGDDEVAELAASPYLGQLRWLDLTYNDIGQRGVEAIAASTKLPALRFVDFANNPADDPTPRIGEDALTGAIVSVDIPSAARELEAKYGPKPWLSGKPTGHVYPPERDFF